MNDVTELMKLKEQLEEVTNAIKLLATKAQDLKDTLRAKCTHTAVTKINCYRRDDYGKPIGQFSRYTCVFCNHEWEEDKP